MGSYSNYRSGSHLWICDRCGFQYHAEDKRREWTGLITCPECWEPRHPQDFVKAKVDNQTVSDPRPEATDAFIGPVFLEDVNGDILQDVNGINILSEDSTEVSL